MDSGTLIIGVLLLILTIAFFLVYLMNIRIKEAVQQSLPVRILLLPF